MGKRRHRWVTPQVRRQVIALAADGVPYSQIVAQLDTPMATVGDILQPLGGVFRRESWRPSEARLSLEERIEIRLGLERGTSVRQIAASIGRAASTVSREVHANGGRDDYRPWDAHERARQQARRPKPSKLSSCPGLRERVIGGLERLWSPQQIVQRLRCEFGEDRSMQISHETIYKSLYVQGRGELRRELSRCLRTGRAKRKPRNRSELRGRIPGMVMISQRPAEATDRAVPGHWEGDLLVGKNNTSAIGTLVERATRFVMLLHLEGDKTAETVRDAMTRTIQTLPAALKRSITWDQGREMSEHAQFTVDTGVQVYFCDPHAPWQRGSNENTNGLLRQYFPKGTDLSVHTKADLRRVADSLNGRPRQTLGWMTPSERLAELVATTG